MWGSIPAWAGEPYSGQLQPPVGPVYPRVGGGTGWNQSPKIPSDGLSPRGRGNHPLLWAI